MNNELIYEEFWTDEKLEELQKLAALQWSKIKMAKYFKLDLRVFKNMVENSVVVRQAFDYGRVVYQAKADVGILKAVENESITAIQIFQKNMDQRIFNESVMKEFFDE